MTNPALPARREFLVASAAATAMTATAASATSAAAPPAGRRHVLPDPMPMPAPQLVVANPGEQAVLLRSVRVHAEIVGRIAQTDVEMVFFNPNGRVLEGELQFPLLDGQSVVGFALDIDGTLRDAVPIDKVRGRQVFEDIVRGQVDPGLLQQTAGNHYKLRVYPLPARGTRTVVIRHAETLGAAETTRPAGALRVYRLPLVFANTSGEMLDSLAATVRVSGAGAQAPRARWRALARPAGGTDPARGAPAASAGAAPATRVPQFARDGDTWVAAVETSLVDPRSPLLEVAVTDAGGVQVTRGDFQGAAYFTAEIPLAVRRAPRPAPRRVLLAWDSSGSGAARDHARELALLDAWFRRIGAQVPEIDVQLQRLRDAAEPIQSFTVVNGRWGALRQALAATAYDGATDLGALRVPVDRSAVVLSDLVVLFTDGLSNYGERRLARFDVPLFAVVSTAGADTGRLQRAAERSGGRLIDLLGADSAPAAALDKLLTATTRVIAIEADGAADVVPMSPYPRDGRVELAGRFVGSLIESPTQSPTAATLRLTLAQPDGRPQTVTVPLATQQTSRLAAQLYARTRIAQLDPDDEPQRAEARRLATTFGIVSRDTALIVLERAADYVRYDIAPPADTKLAADVARLRTTTAVARERDGKVQVDRVARMFADKQAWWQREFPKGDRPLPVTRPKASRDEIGTAAASAPAEERRLREGERARREADAAGDVSSDRSAPARSVAPSAAPPASPLLSLRQNLAAKEGVARGDARGAGNAGPGLLPHAPEVAATIRLQRWTPDAPYMQRLRAAAPYGLYDVYLAERERYTRSTAFFLDAADLLFERGEPGLARRVLSNLAELDLDNRHVLRILGLRLLQAGQAREAVRVLREVLALAPDEPQSWRDLGLALAADGQYQQAVDTLYEVIARPWHGRFPEIELITLAEINAIAATAPASLPLDTRRIDARLKVNLPLDLRVVMTWDADNTDIDLWVTDPNGERAYYGNRQTYQGGRMSLDFTGGYGPEEFSLRHAKAGRYKVEANFFGHRQQIVAGATTLNLKLTTGFGTPHAHERAVTMRLRDKGGVVFVGEFDVVPSPA